MDNASNNDTMMQSLSHRLAEDNIEFNACHARGRCLPHIVHLAALKVCSHLLLLHNCEHRNSSFLLVLVQCRLTMSRLQRHQITSSTFFLILMNLMILLSELMTLNLKKYLGQARQVLSTRYAQKYIYHLTWYIDLSSCGALSRLSVQALSVAKSGWQLFKPPILMTEVPMKLPKCWFWTFGQDGRLLTKCAVSCPKFFFEAFWLI